MVEAVADHGAGLHELLAGELFVEEFVFGGELAAVAPAQGFLPDEDAHFVAVVEEALRLLVVASADEIGAEGFQVLQIEDHERFGGGGAEGGMGLVAVDAAQVQGLAVEPEAAVARLDLADAEACRNAELRFRGGLRKADRHGVQVRRIRGPRARVGDAHGGASAAERRRDFVASVEEERRVEIGRREAVGLDLDGAGGPVAGPDEKPAVVEDEGDAVVEAAVEIEVVVGAGELERRVVEAVVEGGEEDVRAGGEGAGFEFEACVRVRMDAEGASVDAEIPAQAHAVDHEPRIGNGAVEDERATVECGASLAQPLRHGVEAPRHRHPLRGGESGVGDGFEGLVFLEAEVPRAVK